MAKQPRTLAGRVVAITGAARGIGRATAVALVGEGATVAIGDIDLDVAERTAEEIGPGAAAFALDVTDRGIVRAFLARVEARFGAVDALVNNAGIMPLGPFVEEDDATARRMIDINVHGVMLGMKLALPRFVARGEGHLINIASAAGKAPYPGGATYCGTKHFVVGVTRPCAASCAGRASTSSVVMPVVVDTELASGLGTARGIPPRPAGRRRRGDRRDAAPAALRCLRAEGDRAAHGARDGAPAARPRARDAGHRSGPGAVGRPRPAARSTSCARRAPSRPWTPRRDR